MGWLACTSTLPTTSPSQGLRIWLLVSACCVVFSHLEGSNSSCCRDLRVRVSSKNLYCLCRVQFCNFYMIFHLYFSFVSTICYLPCCDIIQGVTTKYRLLCFNAAAAPYRVQQQYFTVFFTPLFLTNRVRNIPIVRHKQCDAQHWLKIDCIYCFRLVWCWL